VIAVLDYGIGNLRSAEKALAHLGAEVALVTDPAKAERAEAVVLPGVGAFGACAAALSASGLDATCRRAVEAGIPFLGICVGFQLLFEASEEDPEVPGLGLLPGTVRRLGEGVKLPQMQWNRLERSPGTSSVMLERLGERPWFYFVHSYAPELSPALAPVVVGTCDYGGTVVAAIEAGPLWGVQFHPEKSSATGLALLRGFVEQVQRVAA
jgi:glutamine amidotransferase